MLAHDPWQSMDRCSHQGVALLQFPKRQVERLFVPMEVLIIKIGILVEPKCKAERVPASLFIYEDLARFKLLLSRRTHSATAPDRNQLLVLAMLIIGPENRPDSMELRSVKQKLGISDRDIVRIQ